MSESRCSRVLDEAMRFQKKRMQKDDAFTWASEIQRSEPESVSHQIQARPTTYGDKERILEKIRQEKRSELAKGAREEVQRNEKENQILGSFTVNSF